MVYYLRALLISLLALFFGLIAAIAIGVLVWIPGAWAEYARDDRTQDLVLLAMLMSLLAAATLGMVFKLVFQSQQRQASTPPSVVYLALLSSAGFGIIATFYTEDWRIALSVGTTIVCSLAKIAVLRRARRNSRSTDASSQGDIDWGATHHEGDECGP